MTTYREFEEALAADEKLQAKCTELMGECNPKNEEEVLAAMSQVAAKLGFDVPESEFRLAQLAAQELDDEQLDMVAGGSNPRCESSYKNCKKNDIWCWSSWSCALLVHESETTCVFQYECSFDQY